MNRTASSAKEMLRALRAVPAINAPVTNLVRAAARSLNVTPEWAIKHLPRSGEVAMALPNGRRARIWSRGDDWVANQVFWRGWDGYERDCGGLFWDLARRATVTVDVGAHVGYFTVLAAIANPNGRVLAFEPFPSAFERLQRNLRLNGLSNVTAFQKAVGASAGPAEFFHVPVGGIPSSSSLSEEFMSTASGVESLAVDVVRLETLASELGIGHIDLVKIDTETTEPQVLAGMGSLLAESEPDIFCEVLKTADVMALTEVLESVGYEYHLLTEDGPQRRDAIVPDERWPNYFFTTGKRQAAA
jgi:FkbM family methyltransferase